MYAVKARCSGLGPTAREETSRLDGNHSRILGRGNLTSKRRRPKGGRSVRNPSRATRAAKIDQRARKMADRSALVLFQHEGAGPPACAGARETRSAAKMMVGHEKTPMTVPGADIRGVSSEHGSKAEKKSDFLVPCRLSQDTSRRKTVRERRVSLLKIGRKRCGEGASKQ